VVKTGRVLRSAALLLAGGLLAPAVSGRTSTSVGFAEIRVANGAEHELTGGVWYPTDAPAAEHPLGLFRQTVALDAPARGRDLALVVVSHGGGGSYQSHYDTALALAHAGFVVAAIDQAGDTFEDQPRVLELWRRPEQLSRLVSYMLDEWPQRDHLGARRVGAFGFSNGGFTVLVAAGGVPDLDEVAPYCSAHPGHDLCRALSAAGVDPRLGRNAPPGAWRPDPRIGAAVIAAPAFGFAFGRSGLEGVRVPIQLWGASDDRHQPAPWYEEAVRVALPRPPEYHIVPRAGHFAFLPPCGPVLRARAPGICDDAPGFHRPEFHDEFNRQVVRFFRLHLGGAREPG